MATITPAKKPKYAVIGVRIIRMTYRTVLSEPEPISVQVVEWVGLVASGFQFLLGLAAVFAEEVGGSTIGQSAKVW